MHVIHINLLYTLILNTNIQSDLSTTRLIVTLIGCNAIACAYMLK